MDLSQPRGIRDIEPDEFDLHLKIRRAFEEVARAYNFKLMEPGPLESLSILRAKSGSQVDDQIYAFKDKADRDIGLRFDLTVGMTRNVSSKKGLKPPIKLASYGGVWRYDEPQHARYRWFYQWDVEIFGDQTAEADAEVMDLCYNLFKKVGLQDFSLEVGDRRVVEEYIRQSMGVASEEELMEMMRALDKVQKKTEEELLEEYSRKGVSGEALSELLKFGRTRGSPDVVCKRLEELRLASTGDGGLVVLRDSLRSRGVQSVEYNLSIVRGLDYYTGIVFEVVDRKHPELGSLCGGGRYDVLPRLFGRPDLPATGAAGGVERIALSMGNAAGGVDVELSVYVTYTEPGLAERAIATVASLRGGGIRSEIGTKGKSLGKQLEDASSRGFAWVVIIGKRELETGELVLRNMLSREEERIPVDGLLARLSRA
ncbi:MAG TPA: histidine--tRNA ligase [Nitrososphaerales archaeon]|nr:histidine--tRNA ligase [Nitrososphaerales archaeon]